MARPTIATQTPASEELRETFERLAYEWERNRPRGVDVAQMTQHPAYQRIIDMGEPAVPWLLRRLSEKPNHWFVALNAITGARPVPPASRGRIKEMAQAWLEWGRQNGYELTSRATDNCATPEAFQIGDASGSSLSKNRSTSSKPSATF